MKAIYATRYSDPKQKGNTSTEVQVEVIEKYCEENGFEIIGKNIVETESAKQSNTARIAQLLNFAKQYQGKAEVMVVFKVDRFARDVAQHYYLKTELLKMGISLRSATEPIGDSPQGKLLETILAGFAEFDNSIKRERVKLAMWQRVSKGLWPWPAPIGYKSEPVKGVKLSPHVEDKECSWAPREIFLRYSSGVVHKSQLAKEFSQKKIKNHLGVVLKFSKQTIDNMLDNPYYMGYLKDENGNLIKGLHKPLIEPALFEKCQAVKNNLSNNATKKRLKFHPDFPLRGHVNCGFCGQSLTACWAKSGQYPYYYCYNPKCKNYAVSIKKSDIENNFVEYLKRVKPKDNSVKRFNLGFVKRYRERETEIRGDYLRQLDEIKKLTEDEDWVVTRGKKGILPDSVVKKEVDEIENKISLAKLQLNETHMEELDVNALLAYAENFIRTVELAWFDAPFEIKLRLQKLIFPKGLNYKEGVFSNYELSLLFGLINNFATEKSKDVTPLGFEPKFPG